MDIEKFLELTRQLEKKKKGKNEELEKVKKLFDRFHLLNRKYINKETFDKAQESISSMGETITNTINYLDDEIARLRSKRMRLPFENVELGEIQKVQKKNEILIKEFLTSFPK